MPSDQTLIQEELKKISLIGINKMLRAKITESHIIET